MILRILKAAEEDLEQAFDWYEHQKSGLGQQFIEEFRRALEEILRWPYGWNRLSDRERRFRLHRFPYGVVYEILEGKGEIMITQLQHLHSHRA